MNKLWNKIKEKVSIKTIFELVILIAGLYAVLVSFSILDNQDKLNTTISNLNKENIELKNKVNDTVKEVDEANTKVKKLENEASQAAAAAKKQSVAKQTEVTDNKVDDKKQTTVIEYNTYGNARFGFHINYPNTWLKTMESDNGDGIILTDAEGSTNEFRLSGIYDLDGIEMKQIEEDRNSGKEVSEVKTDSGETVYVIVYNEDGKVIYHSVLIDEKNQIAASFYATVNTEYYEANKDTFLAIAKSINID